MNHFVGRFEGASLTTEGNSTRFSATFGCTVLLAGYLANRVDLCRQLGLGDGAAESECVAGIYRRCGAQLAAHVLGEYAAVIFDPLNGSLLLVHDALGILPLFYAQHGSQVLFSNHLASLVAIFGTRELDEDYLLGYLAVADDPGERTPYRQIKRVPQGKSLTVRNGFATMTTVFDPAQVDPLRLSRTEAYEERFRELVTQAVASVFPSAGKVWCELSGGLDSSTLVSVASGTLKAPVEAFSLSFSRSHRADESRWREIVLAAFPLRSHVLDADCTPPFSSVPEQFQAEPTGTSLVCALDEARRALFVENSVDIILTGMCGDAVFVGDSPEPFYLADLRNPWNLFSQLRLWEKFSPQRRSLTFWFMRYVIEPHRSPLPPTMPGWIGERYRDQQQGVWETTHCSGKLPGLSAGDQYFWDRVLRGALSTRDGQQPFSDICQFRNPWLSLPLVKFMAAIPWSAKLHPQTDRVLQRSALRGILPEPIRQRVGKGVPTQALIAGLKASEEWSTLLTEHPAIVERGYVEPQLWRRAVELARHGLCESPAGFMRACTLEAWFHTLNHKPRSLAETGSNLVSQA